MEATMKMQNELYVFYFDHNYVLTYFKAFIFVYHFESLHTNKDVKNEYSNILFDNEKLAYP